jgi:hypothetical protein
MNTSYPDDKFFNEFSLIECFNIDRCIFCIHYHWWLPGFLFAYCLREPFHYKNVNPSLYQRETPQKLHIRVLIISISRNHVQNGVFQLLHARMRCMLSEQFDAFLRERHSFSVIFNVKTFLNM